MKVLIDGGNSGSGGYLRYLQGILAPTSLPDGVDVVLLASPRIVAALQPLHPAVEVLAEPALDHPRRHRRLGWWRRQYPALVRRVRPDVVLHPSGIARGDSGGVPRVAIHHVMAPFVPATYRLYGFSRDSLRFLLLQQRLAHSFRRVDGVIFHADYTRQVVQRTVRGIPRTAIVPNAVPDGFTAPGTRDYAHLASPVRLLCVSTLYLFKHQWNVVDAVADLAEESGTDIHVDFVGGGEPRARARLQQRIEQRGKTGSMRLLEGVAPEEMPRLYDEANLFVFPSADETWPITLLEAMASGLPIACADRMAMPQMLGDAGVYFDPESSGSTRDALRTLLTDPELRAVNGRRAAAYSAQYRWDRSSAAVFRFLAETAAA